MVSPDFGFCDLKTPQDILDFVAENVVADAQAIESQSDVIFSPSEPTGPDFGKIWVKATGTERGIYIVVDGKYVPILIQEDVPEPPNPNFIGETVLGPIGTAAPGWTPVTDVAGLPVIPGGSSYQYFRYVGT